MEKKHGLLILVSVLCVSVYYYHSSKVKKLKVVPVSFISAPFEIEPRSLITADKEILFSATNSNSFSLYSYKNKAIHAINSSLRDVFSPFLLAGRQTGLQDHNGDENFMPLNHELDAYTDSRPVNTLFSFKNGYLIVFLLNDNDTVYMADLKKKEKKVLFSGVKKLHSVCFSEKYNFIVVDYDDQLSCIDIIKPAGNITNLAINTQGESMNPYIYDRYVYFSGNEASEFYQLFKINLDGTSIHPELIVQSAHDLRMPKFDGKNLFFIEIINNEYLLRKLNSKTKKQTAITTKGVVYNYDFYDRDNIIFSYCDFNTPKSIIKYQQSDNSLSNLTGLQVKLDLSCELIKRSTERSPAYIICPNNKKSIKGVILFFHPGLHSDFSPRWDPVIMNLSDNGYIIVSPNYPMSSGFGKSYYTADFSATLNDMANWKKYVKNNYSDLPLYYLSSSSGNILMEQSLANDHKGVEASASLFGLPGSNPDPLIPSLYILGGNDPVVSFNVRNHDLREAEKENSNISVTSYYDEGHWFRSSINTKSAIAKLVGFFSTYD